MLPRVYLPPSTSSATRVHAVLRRPHGVRFTRRVAGPRPGVRPRHARPPTSSRYQRHKRRVLRETAGQTWVYFAAVEALLYASVCTLAVLLAHALGLFD